MSINENYDIVPQAKNKKKTRKTKQENQKTETNPCVLQKKYALRKINFLRNVCKQRKEF